ncbi:MAG: pilus assembly PilX family protein [Parashewanella sp.]
MKKQRGVVLFFALVVLILMTIIGVSLATNSIQSIKMAGAGAERLEAIAHAQGSQASFVEKYQGKPMLTDLTAKRIETDAALKVTHTITTLAAGDTNCGRSSYANSAKNISCRKIQVSSAASYGRGDLGRLIIVAGIEQQVLSGN